jgi:solute carrier family 10 (sodium/bile acid cotransporter), member 7
VGWLGRYWFVLALLAVPALAFAFPGLGASGGPLAPEVTTRAGVAMIFLIQGLALPPAALRQGAMRWRLHLATQLFIFAAFPAAVLLLDMLVGTRVPADIRTGFIFLALLPTTISTCVVLTAAAGGNVSGALFNAAFSNIAGVVITPLLVAMLLDARGETAGVLPMISQVGALLLAPLALGQLLRPLVRRFWEPDRRLLGNVSNGIILFIIFCAFADSVHGGAFAGDAAVQALAVLGGASLLFALATFAAAALGRQLRLDAGDRLALLFCAPHKTLAAGVPMAQVLFAGDPALGVILLPLIIYHVVQLVAGAALANR